MKKNGVRVDIKGLEKFKKILEAKLKVEIGILGDATRTSKKGDGPTNAEIGAKHEFGEDGMPVRSFLRMPLSEHMQEGLEKAGFFNSKTLNQAVAEDKINSVYEKIGLTAEAVVQEAFDTGGFGKWRPSNMTRKKNQQTLVETQQLRNSVVSRVKGTQ